MLKSELRREMRQRKRQFSPQQLRELSAPIAERLLAHPRVKMAKTILLYSSLPDEVDTSDAIRRLLLDGKAVFLPAVTGKGEMEVRQLTDFGQLSEGAYQILEPRGAALADLTAIDVAIVPGMGFDADGHRLGRGGGYYDRFLPKIPQAYKIGVCFDFQKVVSVPVGALDVAVDEVL